VDEWTEALRQASRLRAGMEAGALLEPPATVSRWVGDVELVTLLPGLRCPVTTREGHRCTRGAGEGTVHEGAGRCRSHRGSSPRRAREGAWAVAHAYARQMDTTPWQALLGEVRRTAGALAWLDAKVGEADDDEALLRPVAEGGVREWRVMRDQEREHGAKVAKMALDAGVAERLVAQAEYEGSQVAGVLSRTLDRLVAAGLSVELLSAARGIMREELLALDAPEHGVVEGHLVEDNVVRGPW
jgi:hypothetical protein